MAVFLEKKLSVLNVKPQLRSIYTERDRDRGLTEFAKEWSK